MTEEEAVEVVSQRFLDRWSTESSGVTSCLEGDPLPGADSFVMLSIMHLLPRQLTQGRSARVQRNGLIWVKSWTPAGSGTKARAQLADAARHVFERQQLGPALTERMTIGVGRSQEGGTDGRWMISAVSFPFSYVETVTSTT